jgi:hypothetical protein
MKRVLWLAAFVCLASSWGFAESWRGELVDSKCFDALERNVNPTDSLTAVDRDRGSEVEYCSPGAKTKLFAIVTRDGANLKLDSSGNAKAGALVQQTGKKSWFPVVVTGEMDKSIIKVDSISAAR